MKFVSTAAFLTLFGRSVADTSNGLWCAEPSHLGSKSADDIKKFAIPGLSYRGQFRDFSLFVESSEGIVRNCEVFLEHHVSP